MWTESFCHIGLEDGTQAASPGGKLLFPLSHLSYQAWTLWKVFFLTVALRAASGLEYGLLPLSSTLDPKAPGSGSHCHPGEHSPHACRLQLDTGGCATLQKP